MIRQRLKLLAAGLLISSLAGAQEFVFPTAPLFTTVPAVVFPGAGGAAVANASALVSPQKSTSLTFVNSLPFGQSAYGVEAVLAHVNKTYGFSAGYVGSVGTGTTTHGYLAAVAAKIAVASVGASVYKIPGSTGTPSVDASATLPMLGEMAFTALLKGVATTPQATLGLGLHTTGFQAEAFLELPPFSLPSAGNAIGMAVAFSLGNLSLHASAKKQTVTKTTQYTGGLGLQLNERIHVSVQYDDERRLNAGVTLGL